MPSERTKRSSNKAETVQRDTQTSKKEEPQYLYTFYEDEPEHWKKANKNDKVLQPLREESKGKKEDDDEDEGSRNKPFVREVPSKILDYLYVGDEADAKNKDRLKQLGIGYVINLSYGENAHPDEFKYLRIDIYDAPLSNIKQHFPKCIEFIEEALAANSKVLVHCAAGLSRSPSICIAFIMQKMKWSLKQTYGHVSTARGFIMPNDGFINQLIEYEKELFGTTTMQRKNLWVHRVDENAEQGGGTELKVQPAAKQTKPPKKNSSGAKCTIS